MSENQTLYFVVGPTCSGKSHWAQTEALKNGGEIVNADSVQIYKGLNIGSAKPTLEEFGLLPHHLYDLIDPSGLFTAGDYRRVGLEIIEKRLPEAPLYVVGGSGFYLQALEFGMFEVAPIPGEITTQVQQLTDQGQLYSRLSALDPVSAQKISENDEYRLQRALEVTINEGRPFSEIQKEFKSKREALGDRFNIKKIGLTGGDRTQLRERVAARTEKMLQGGLLEEVEGLIRKGFGETKALKSVGYKECVAFLAGRLTRAELAPAIVISTMQLAKRQMTWFKRDSEISWISAAK